jgi:hypothetical protein
MAEFYNDSESQMDTNLILCIEEHDSKDDFTLIDNRLFIAWNLQDDDYYVRGKRQDTINFKYVPYAFHCDSTHDLYNFIEFIMGTKRNVSITMYNYNNIDDMSDAELTYEFFEEQMDHQYEIAAYDSVKLKRSQLVKWLRMLKSTYNWNNDN